MTKRHEIAAIKDFLNIPISELPECIKAFQEFIALQQESKKAFSGVGFNFNNLKFYWDEKEEKIMADEIKIITPELLKTWGPCEDGYERFCELFPDGTDLQTAIDALTDDGNEEWGFWLFDRCKKENLFKDITIKGYKNTGGDNTGYYNSGESNSGGRNSGNCNTGSRNSGDHNSGSRNSGGRNSGNCNTGDCNTGSRNSGDHNSGSRNSGNCNTGDCNTGARNSGDHNSGNWNSGDWNSGDCNSGDWNSGNRTKGYFNSVSNDVILVFNKPCKLDAWRNAYKPYFLFFELTYWVDESEMTEEEKKADPYFYIRGGHLRKRDYKEAFKKSWDEADPEDRIKVKDLPNFDAQVFFEISGIDLREERQGDSK